MRRFPELLIGFLLGFATLLVILLLSSDIATPYEVCETTRQGAKECATYGVVHFALHEIGAALDVYNGVITAIATAFFAWFTLSLRRATDRLWDAGERQLKFLSDSAAAQSSEMQASIEASRRSAEAAELSAKAAVAIELPVITAFPQHFSWGVTQDVNSKVHHCSVNHIAFYNHGRTDAYLSELRCGWLAGDSLPDVPTYQFIELIEADKILGQKTQGDVRTDKF
jgi:hypothetical protein